MEKYVLFSETDPVALEYRINNYAGAGWRLVGCVQVITSGYGTILYVATMEREV